MKEDGWLYKLSSALSILEANETPLQSSVVLAQVDVCLTAFYNIDDDELKNRAAILLCKWKEKWESDKLSFAHADLISDLSSSDTLAEGQKPKPPSASSTSMSSSVLPMTDNSTCRRSQRNRTLRQRYDENCWKDWSAVDLGDDLPPD